MRPEPVLAESMEKSADGRTITLNIKQGVTWHDGSPFTSTDVAYTFRMIRSGVTNYTQNLANVETLAVMDAKNLAFPDNHFDAVVAQYVITAVPDPPPDSTTSG